MKKAQIENWHIGLVAVVVIVLLIGILAVYNVPEGNVGVLFSKFEGYDYAEKPQGWGIKKPFVERVTDMPFRTQTLGFFSGGKGQYTAITPKDMNGIDFTTDITVRYHIDPAQAAEFTELKGEGTSAMESLLVTAIRSDATRGIFGKYNQEDLPQNRITVAQEITKVLQERINREVTGTLKPNFLVIEAVDIRNINFDERIENKIVEKQSAKQDAERQDYLLQEERKKFEIAVVKANATKQAAIIRAEGEGEAIRTVARAKADGLDWINDAYKGMPEQYVLVKAFEAVKPTDKMYFGFDSITGNQLSFLDMNKLMSTPQLRQIAEEEEE